MSRLLLSYFASFIARIITGIPLRDCTAGFKCFRREVLEKVRIDKIDSSGYAFQIEMNFFAWKNKFRIAEIPIVFTDRQRGASKMSTKIIREGIILLWKLRLRSIFAGKP
jgi:dolichol-phosphate mannosyltransferase